MTGASPLGPRDRVGWANGLRGIAALSVVAFHYCVVFWNRQDVAADLARREPLYADASAAPQWSRWISAIPIDLGALGVSLFFVLSGFVIAISLERYSRLGFLVGRLMRVLPTYAAGYLVTITVVALMGDPHDEVSVPSVLVGAVPGLGILTHRSVPGDGIVWTLIIELSFYSICLVAFRRLTRTWWVPVAVAAGCVAVQFGMGDTEALGPSLSGLSYVLLLTAPFLPVLLVGVVLFAIRRGDIEVLGGHLLIAGLLGVHAWLASTSRLVPTSVEYRATFVAGALAVVAIAAFGRRWSGGRAVTAAASVSYPLYVVHPVLGYALISVLASRGVPALLAVATAALVAVGAAAALHVLVERPTHRWGRQWARSVSPVPRTAAEPIA